MITVKVFDEEGWEFEVELPSVREVCSRCDGRGVHDNPNFSNGFTSEEMYEQGPEFQEEYMAGVYDVTCTECHGKNVVEVPQEKDLTPEQERNLELYYKGMEELADLRAEEEAERRMGC